MFKAVYYNGTNINVNHQEYLKKHKIMFYTPQYKGYNGFPIGNGMFGGMVYHSKSKTHFVLNHTDAIDFSEDGNFDAWSFEGEEVNTAHVSCAHLTITDYMPSFDTLYLQEYEGALDIGNGMLDISAKTEFSKNYISAFINERYQMEVITYESSSVDKVARGLELSRWGSRNFFHDYEQISTDKTKNLGGTFCGEQNGCIYVTQKVRGCETVTLMYIDSESEKEPAVKSLNRHAMQVYFGNAEQLKVKIYLRVIAKELVDIEKESKNFREDLQKYSYEEIVKAQCEEWKKYWKQSFVHLPKDEYLENIYYMYSYMMNSCSKGKYPVTFGSIWCHNHDTRNWGHYYHWNHQQAYWGLWAAGKEALCKNYLEYRFAMLPNAIEDGKRLFHVEGAFFSDISNYNGYQALEPDTVRNLTCGAQIALDFYRYYKYTGDKQFMKDKAYPFMSEVMKLYEGLLVKNKKGYYEIEGGSTCYESYWNLKQTITDHMMLRALCKCLLELGSIVGEKEEKLKIWKDFQINIYPVQTTKAQLDGKQVDIISAGMKWDNEVVHYLETAYPLNTFGLCQMTGVFPAGIVNLQSKKEDLELYKNTAAVIFRDYVYEQRVKTAGHNMAPILAARLGMKEDTIKILHHFLENYQYYKNGLCHFANIKKGECYPKEYCAHLVSYNDVTNWEKIHEKSEGKRVWISGDDLIHSYFEAHGEIFATVNEMLLQSCEGVIRVFPSVPNDYSGVFSLRVEGGHEVISEMKDGEIRYIAVNANQTEQVQIVNPFYGEIRVLCNTQNISFKRTEGNIRFNVEKGGHYVVESCEAPLGQYYRNEIPTYNNTKVKYFAGNQIGCERRF